MQPIVPKSRLIPIAQAAEAWNVPVTQLRAAARSGALDAKLPRGANPRCCRWMVTEEAMERYVAEGMDTVCGAYQRRNARAS